MPRAAPASSLPPRAKPRVTGALALPAAHLTWARVALVAAASTVAAITAAAARAVPVVGLVTVGAAARRQRGHVPLRPDRGLPGTLARANVPAGIAAARCKAAPELGHGEVPLLQRSAKLSAQRNLEGLALLHTKRVATWFFKNDAS